MSKRGRPSKLTPEVHERVVQLIAGGNYIETAAAAAGVHKDSLYHWLKLGAAQDKGVYRAFSDAVQKAAAESEGRDVLLIAHAARTQWQAAAWRLERKFPAKWGQRVQLTVREELSAALSALREGLDQDEYAKVVQLLSNAGEAGEQ